MKQESIPDTLLKSGEFSKAPGRAEGLKAGDSILFCRDGKAGAPTLPSPERRQHPGAGPEKRGWQGSWFTHARAAASASRWISAGIGAHPCRT